MTRSHGCRTWPSQPCPTSPPPSRRVPGPLRPPFLSSPHVTAKGKPRNRTTRRRTGGSSLWTMMPRGTTQSINHLLQDFCPTPRLTLPLRRFPPQVPKTSRFSRPSPPTLSTTSLVISSRTKINDTVTRIHRPHRLNRNGSGRTQCPSCPEDTRQVSQHILVRLCCESRITRIIRYFGIIIWMELNLLTSE